jgi:hypothetical protein
MKNVVRKKKPTEINKIAKDILKKTEITRSEASYLIKTYLKKSVLDFAKENNISFHYLNESLIAIRPFSAELQTKILKIIRDKN